METDVIDFLFVLFYWFEKDQSTWKLCKSSDTFLYNLIYIVPYSDTWHWSLLS
jgi:hypothetical protein